MKHWKCPVCNLERETEDKVIMSICSACLNSMEEIKERMNGNFK